MANQDPGASEGRSPLPAGGTEDGPKKRIIQDVLQGIYSGRYKPGMRVKESEITARHGVSRGPVREAFNAMAGQGLLDITIQRGAAVRRLSADEAVDILCVVQRLVGLAARCAAERGPASQDLQRLRAAVDAVPRRAPDAESAMSDASARDAFYAALTALSGNAELRRVLPNVQVHLIRVQFRSELGQVDGHRLDDYRRIYAAVAAGDAEAADAAAQAHIERAILVLQQASAVG